MGIITIETSGSFGKRLAQFSAEEEGHASAVSKAIAHLAGKELPMAIALDHRLAREGDEPRRGFAGIGARIQAGPTKAEKA